MLNNSESVKFCYINKCILIYILNNTTYSNTDSVGSLLINNIEGGRIFCSGPIVSLQCASVDR